MLGRTVLDGKLRSRIGLACIGKYRTRQKRTDRDSLESTTLDGTALDSTMQDKTG